MKKYEDMNFNMNYIKVTTPFLSYEQYIKPGTIVLWVPFELSSEEKELRYLGMVTRSECDRTSFPGYDLWVHWVNNRESEGCIVNVIRIVCE